MTNHQSKNAETATTKIALLELAISRQMMGAILPPGIRMVGLLALFLLVPLQTFSAFAAQITSRP